MKLAYRLYWVLATVVVLVVGAREALWIEREQALITASSLADVETMGEAIRPAFVSAWRSGGKTRALEMLEFADQRFHDRRRVGIRWWELDELEARPELAPLGQLEALRRAEVVHATSSLEADNLVVFVPVRAEGLPAGAFELSRWAQPHREFIRGGVLSAVIGLAVVLLLLGVLLLAVTKWVVDRPLSQLARQARRIAQGDFSVRLRPDRSPDVGFVAQEMNEMCDCLVEARERVRAEHAAHLDSIEHLRHADRLATVGQLAAGIAHELGTPLNVVRGHAKLITQGGLERPEAARSAGIIVRQVERMSGIIRDLLDYARAHPRSRACEDLRQLAQRAVDMLQPLAKKRGVELVVAVPARPCEVVGDSAQLEQLLANLLVNGLQATRRNGVVTVRVESDSAPGLGEPQAAFLRLAVEDQGEGIPHEQLPRVFEPFFSTKAPGEGTGLGLPIAQQIAREHGGWIDVQSTPGAGAVFSVHLPAVAPAPGTGS